MLSVANKSNMLIAVVLSVIMLSVMATLMMTLSITTLCITEWLLCRIISVSIKNQSYGKVR